MLTFPTFWLGALEFFAEWRLACDVVAVKVDRKVVVGPEYIHDQFREFLLSHPSVPDCVLAKAADRLAGRQQPEAQRQWLRRWRERWGFSYRSLPNRSIMPNAQNFGKSCPTLVFHFLTDSATQNPCAASASSGHAA